MGKERLHLPKLVVDRSNWIAYRDRIQWSMKMRGLGDHLTHKAVIRSYLDAGDISRVSLIHQWVGDEITASGLLDATIPDEVFREIKNTEHVMEVWDSKKRIFEEKLRSVMMDLGRKFQTTRCGKDDDVRAHFSKLAHPREKLSALGRAISDDEYVLVLIGSLPSCYDSPIDSLTSSCDVNNMDITSTVVIRAAMREYEKRVLRKEKMKLSLPPQKPARRPRRKTLNASIARRRVITSQSAGQRVMGRRVGRRRPGTRTRTRMASAKPGTARTEPMPQRPRRHPEDEYFDESWAVIQDRRCPQSGVV